MFWYYDFSSDFAKPASMLLSKGSFSDMRGQCKQLETRWDLCSCIWEWEFNSVIYRELIPRELQQHRKEMLGAFGGLCGSCHVSAPALWWSGHGIFDRNILEDPRDPFLQSSWVQRKIIYFIYLPLKLAPVVPGKGVLGALCERPVPHQRRLCTSIASSLLRPKLVWEDGGSQRRPSSGWRNGRAQENEHQSSEMHQQFHWSCSGCSRGTREMGFFEDAFLGWPEISQEQVCLGIYTDVSGFS